MGLHHTNDQECPLCKGKLTDAHPFMQNWFWEAKTRYPNLHVAWAYRGQADQEKFFAEGKTRVHFPNSFHNKLPSLALDLFLVDEDGAARFPPMFYAKLNEENKAKGLPLKWGGEFKSLGDADHFQYAPSPAV